MKEVFYALLLALAVAAVVTVSVWVSCEKERWRAEVWADAIHEVPK